MLILGIAATRRNSAAALIDAGRIVGAMEEHKLVARHEGAGRMPAHAIEFCQKQAGGHGSSTVAIPIATAGRAAAKGLQLVRVGLPRVSAFDHHLCHAASAYFPSPFDSAVVLTLDETGGKVGALVAVGEGTRLKPFQTPLLPVGLGGIYTAVTALLGFRPHVEESKTQWLSSEGSPDFLPVLEKLLTHTPGSVWPEADTRLLRTDRTGTLALANEIVTGVGLQPGGLPPTGAHRAAIASSVQALLEGAVVRASEQARRLTRARYLCLAGGVFSNTRLVQALEEQTGYERVFVQPAATNAGSALGAAFLARAREGGTDWRVPLEHLYLGPRYSDQDVKAVLDNCKIAYDYFQSEEVLLRRSAEILAQHSTLAWFHGRLEFGPRALGNRSVVASPLSRYVTQNLNEYIKHRDNFHPFGLSVPEEEAPRFFACSENCRYMASCGTLKDGHPDLEPFAFDGRRIRVHLVREADNPRFWGLLRAFERVSGIPILVNTSFNLFGEPLVCDPRAAVRSFYCAGIDAMVIERFLLHK